MLKKDGSTFIYTTDNPYLTYLIFNGKKDPVHIESPAAFSNEEYDAYLESK
ncbi:MAG: hypothetical protein OHK0057_02920 [Thermoflexibacter sp.]